MKLPIISLAIVAGQAAYANSVGGDIWAKLDNFQSLYSGIDFTEKAFKPDRLLLGYGPWVVKRFAGAFARPQLAVRGLPISFS